jgi:transposase
MAAAIDLRSDFDGCDLRRLARASKDGRQLRRLLALAAIYDGGTRGEAASAFRLCATGCCDRGPDGLIDGKAPGAPSLLSAEQRQALIRIVEAGPIPASHGVVHWRLIDLAQWIWDEFGLSIGKQTLSRELRGSGYRKLSARPRHRTQDANATPALKSFPCAAGSNPGDAPTWDTRRDLVAGRGAGWPEERDHPPLGSTRDAAFGAEGPADQIRLHLRRDLPGRGQSSWPRPTPLQFGMRIPTQFGHLFRLDPGRPIVPKPGKRYRYDSEYKRNSTANLFVMVDANQSWRKVKVTDQRTNQDALCMRDLVDIDYSDTDKIRVVMDNLSTHTAAAIYQTFPAAEARRILRRLSSTTPYAMRVG